MVSSSDHRISSVDAAMLSQSMKLSKSMLALVVIIFADL
jgi:hypothetical protein